MLTIARLRQSQFARNIVTLATGTLLAQAIPILASPILTRLYTPSEFGLFAVYMALITSVTPAICGKYEVAMVLPKSKQQGEHLLGIAIWVAFFLSLVCFILIFFFDKHLLEFIGVSELASWIYFVPLTLFFTGVIVAKI